MNAFGLKLLKLNPVDRIKRFHFFNPPKPVPSTPVWQSRAQMPVARRLTAATVADGAIYVFGGEELDQILNDQPVMRVGKAILKYDPSQNTWNSLGDMPVPRSTCAALNYGAGEICVVGGIEQYGGTWGQSDRVDIFTPQSNRWSAVGVGIPTAKRFYATVLVDDADLYAIGGTQQTQTAGNGSTATYSNEVYCCSLVFGTASTRAPMPTPRMWLSAVLGADGLIYAMGGLNEDGALATVEAYDPAADTWESRAPMQVPRREFAAVVGPQGHIYALGGMADGDSIASVERYDPVQDSWTSLPDLPVPCMYHSAVIADDNRIFVIGGQWLEDCGDASLLLNQLVATKDPVTL